MPLHRPARLRARSLSILRLAAVALWPALVALAGLACSGAPQSPPDPRAGGMADPEILLAGPEARAGEAIYRRESCGRCHTLFDRAASGAAANLLPGGFDPRAASRVGPDLGLEGHRHSDDWHYAHLYAPAVVVPESRMPAARHLFAPDAGGHPTPLREAIDLVAYLQALGRGRRDVWAEFRRVEPAIPAPPPVDAALFERGDALYRRHCAACHGQAGDGRGAAAELLGVPPRDLVAARYRFKSTPAGEPPADADLFRLITLGTGIGSAMPSFAWLRPADRWALVLRVKGFSPVLQGSGLKAEPRPAGAPESRPPIQPEDSRRAAPSGSGTGSDRGAGERLWGEMGCASCHGRDGAGLTRAAAGATWTDTEGLPVPRSGDLTHACALRGGASGEALERAVLFGVGLAMPAYGDAIDGTEKLGALRDYLLLLQDSPEGPRERE
ncbi:MAG TPA: c-type cytochrome [Candidatus Polarisedimenticolia bacterium]|nr:c-type cytochrome [Candidatus Polarisedimenticolia bacterium]